MAKTKATQTMIDEDFESQFKISDYQRDLKAVESSSRQADKLLKEIAVISMERQLECNTEEERVSTLMHWLDVYQMAKGAYYDAVEVMGIYASHISYYRQYGNLNPHCEEPKKTPSEIAESVKYIKETYCV